MATAEFSKFAGILSAAFVQFFLYSCHLFLISSTSVRSIPFLSFIDSAPQQKENTCLPNNSPKSIADSHWPAWVTVQSLSQSLCWGRGNAVICEAWIPHAHSGGQGVVSPLSRPPRMSRSRGREWCFQREIGCGRELWFLTACDGLEAGQAGITPSYQR